MDFEQQLWVTPAGSVGLSCLIGGSVKKGQRVRVRFGNCKNAAYWNKIRFFETMGLRPSIVHDVEVGVFSELAFVDSDDNIDKITEDVAKCVSPQGEIYQIVAHIISEMLNNVRQHSGSNGFCASQFYEEENRIHICIADYGIGLKNSLEHRYSPSSDAAAVQKALEVAVSKRAPAEQLLTPSGIRNRGVGLSITKALVEKNDGRLDIWSGVATFSTTKGRQWVREGACWNGTLVHIVMKQGVAKATFNDISREIGSQLRAMKAAERKARFAR